MQYLLDTNVFLWSLDETEKLKPPVKKLLVDPKNAIYVSLVSAWEISIKHKTGKLPLKTTLAKTFEVSPFVLLPITLAHVLAFDTLPLRHKDPFDRLLISQAKVEDLTLITSDEQIWKYKVSLLKV